jgi:hypothetical protein
VQEIGEKLGISRQAVHQHAIAAGLPKRRRRNVPSPEELRERYLNGTETLTAMAKNLKVSRTYALLALRSLHVDIVERRQYDREYGQKRRRYQERDAQVAADYLAGVPLKDIMARHNVIHPDIYRCLKNEGVSARRHPQKGILNFDAICEAYMEGDSIASIARRFKVCDATVARIALDAGLPRRRGA